jgi:hypothetical protein
MRRFSVIASVVLAAAAVPIGCGGKPRTASTPPAPAASVPAATGVTGTWSGWAGTGGQSTPATLNLKQDGTAVRGDVSVGGRPDISGPIEGTVSGDSIRFRLTSGAGSTGELRITKGGQEISGIVGTSPLTLTRAR